MGDTVKISASKEGVKFSVTGDIGTGSIMCKQTASADGDEVIVLVLCAFSGVTAIAG